LALNGYFFCGDVPIRNYSSANSITMEFWDHLGARKLTVFVADYNEMQWRFRLNDEMLSIMRVI